MVERLDRAFLENFSEESFAKRGRKVINKSCNTEVVIGNDVFVCIEYLSDLKCDLRLLEAPCEVSYALYNSTYTDIYAGIELT